MSRSIPKKRQGFWKNLLPEPLRSSWAWLRSGSPSELKCPKRHSRLELEPLEDRLAPAVSVSGTDWLTPSWQEQGPNKVEQAQVLLPPNNPVSGAIQAVAVAPSNSSIVYVGGATGGVWKTDDINRQVSGQPSPDWTYTTGENPFQGITALAIHPTNPDMVLAGLGSLTNGSVATYPAGVLLTIDGGGDWGRFDEPFVDKTIHQIVWALSPNASGPDTHVIHVATDKGLYFFADTDIAKVGTPANWTFLNIGAGGTEPVTDIVRDPVETDTYYAAVAGDLGNVDPFVPDPPGTPMLWRNKGVYKTTDQGFTWTNISSGIIFNQGDNNQDSNNKDDDGDLLIDEDPVDLNGDNVLDTSGEGLQLASRIRLALHSKQVVTGGVTTHVQALYAGVVTRNVDDNGNFINRHQLRGLFRSDDGGASWDNLALPTSTDKEEDAAGNLVNKVNPLHIGRQGFKNFSMVADPDNPLVVYVGGDRQPKAVLDANGQGIPATNAVGLVSFEGRIFRGVFDNGSQNIGWAQVVGTGADAAAPTAPHADSRNMAWVPAAGGGGKYLLEVSDGGIVRLVDPDNSDPSTVRQWQSMNGDLGLTEAYSVTYDTGNDVFAIGTQDNGVLVQSGPGSKDWTLLQTGDGGIVVAVPDVPGEFLGTDFGVGTLSRFDITSPQTADYVIASGLKEVDEVSTYLPIPFVLNAVEDQYLLIGDHNLYESDDQGETLNRIVDGTYLNDLAALIDNTKVLPRYYALAYGGEELDANGNRVPRRDVLYAARGDQIVVRHPDPSGNPLPLGAPTTTFFSSPIPGAVKQAQSLLKDVLDIAVAPDDWRRAYAVTVGGTIWETTNGGLDWSPYDTISFARHGIYDPRSIEFYDPNPDFTGDEAILVAGGGGVLFSMGAGGWTPLGKDLPATTFTDLHVHYGEDRLDFNLADDFAYVSSFGRGVWKLPDLSLATAFGNLSIQGTGSNETVTIRMNEAQTEVEVLEGTTPRGSAPVARLTSVDFFGAGGQQDTLIIDNSNGLVVNPYLGNFDYPVFITFTKAANSITPAPASGRPNTIQLKGDPNGKNYFNNKDADNNGKGELYVYGNTPLGVKATRVDYQNVLNIVPDNITSEGTLAINNGIKSAGEAMRGIVDNMSLGKFGLGAGVANPSTIVNTQTTVPRLPGRANVDQANNLPTLTTGLFARLFETGEGAFSIDDIGTLIDTPQLLRDKLEGLDSDTNVQFTDNNGVLTYDVRVNKNLRGVASGNLPFQNGLGELTGQVEFTADVHLHLKFGVDAQGFFLDAGAVSDELTIDNIRGTVDAAGNIGFLAVELTDGEFILDPNVHFLVDLNDPGTGVADGLVRIDEFADLGVQSATFGLLGENDNTDGVDDLTIRGTFQVAAFDFQLLKDLKLEVRWPNIDELGAGIIRASSANPNDPNAAGDPAGSAAKALQFLERNGPEIVGAIQTLADRIEGITGNNFLDAKIPLLNKTLGEVLQGGSTPLDLTGAAISGVTDLYTEDGYKKFKVGLADATTINLALAIGQVVSYQSGGQAVTGTIDSVESSSFAVRFAQDLSQTPDAGTSFHIRRTGGFGKQIRGLADGLSFNFPTLQELIAALEDRTGLELTDNVKLVGTLANLELQITLEFDPEPLTYNRRLDLSDKIEKLKLDGAADLELVVDPRFQITIGVRLAPGVAPADRVYIANMLDDQGNAIPEVQVQLSANFNPQPITGTLGFLDIVLEKTAGVTPNDGITLAGNLTLNIIDPSATPDGRVTLSEIAADPAGAFEPGINASFDIDGLTLRAGLGDTVSLASVNITAHNTANTFAQLPQLFSNLPTITADFIKFKDITPGMALDLLKELVFRLRELNDAGKLDIDLPLIDRNLGELVDLADPLLAKLGDPNDPDNASEEDVSTAQQVADWLNERLGTLADPTPVHVTVGTSETIFTFTVDKTYDAKPIEIDFKLGDGRSLAVLEGDGIIDVEANASATISLGIRTGEVVDKFERFLATGGPNPTILRAGAEANAGYGSNPATLNFTAGVGPLGLSVVDGRAHISATLTGGLDDGPVNDGKLTFREIITAAQNGGLSDLFTANFTGDVQAIIPLDGNGDDIIDYDGPDAPDAQIEVAGLLANIGSINTEIDPVHNSNPADPLTTNQFDDDHLLIHAHNLVGLIQNGLLDPRNLLAGLADFIGWGGNLLDLPIFDREIPFLGVSLRDAFNTFTDNNDGLQGVLDRLEDGNLGESLTNQAILTLVNAMGDLLKDVPGLRVIGDGNRNGIRQDAVTNGHLVSGADLFMLERGTDVIVVKIDTTVTSSTGRSFTLQTEIDPEKAGIIVGDTVRWSLDDGDTISTGKVKQLTATTLTVEANQGADVPTVADGRLEVEVDVHEITGVQLIAKFNPGFERERAFDLGLDFLDLNAQGTVSFEGDVTILLGLGLTKDDGLFLKTNFNDVEMSTLTPGQKEITVGGSVTVTGDLSVKLGFIHFLAEMGTDGDSVDVEFSVDLQDPNADGKLTLTEIIATISGGSVDEDIVKTAFTVAADFDARLTLDTAKSGDLPSFEGDFIFNLPVTQVGTGEAFEPQIAFNDVSLNLGSLVSKIIGPVLEKIGENNPLEPVLDFMTNPLPVMNKSLYDFVKDYLILTENDSALRTLEFFVGLANTINAADELVDDAGTVVIELGDFTIAGDPAPSQAPGGKKVKPKTLATEFVHVFDGQPPGSSTPPADETPENLGSSTDTYPGDQLPVIGPFIADLGEKGIIFPILKLENIAKLIAGDVVDLVFFDFEIALEDPLEFGLEVPIFSFGIPLVANITVEAGIGFEIDPRLNLAGGLDTRGFQKGSFLKGFYLGDFDPGINNQIDPEDEERPEFVLDATVSVDISAIATVLGVTATITGGGTIGGVLSVDLNDDNETDEPEPRTPAADQRTYEERHDGKVYLDEIVTIVQSNGKLLALVDIEGEINAGLFVDVDLPFKKLDRHFEWEWQLANFSLTFPTPEALAGEVDPEVPVEDVPANLGNLVPDAQGNLRHLELTSSSLATNDARNNHAASNHAGGDAVDIMLIDKNNNPYDGVNVAQLTSANTNIENIPNVFPMRFRVNRVFSIASPGVDFVVQGVQTGQVVEYTGTDGNFHTGRVLGVTENQFVVSVEGANPAIASNTSNVTVKSGKETLRIRKNGRFEDFGPNEASENNINLSDLVQIRMGGELFDLGAGNDQFFVDPLIITPVTMRGGLGRDFLVGGRGNDVLGGGEGRDHLDGGPGGNDTLVGGGRADFLDGRNGDDLLVGDYLQNVDNLPANPQEGPDSIFGGSGADGIWSDNKNLSNLADGPEAMGNNVNDVIVGGAGSDNIFAGAGDDDVDGDEDSPTVSPVGGADVIRGGKGRDTLRGQSGDDFITGGFGDDEIVGGRGDDDLFGGGGNGDFTSVSSFGQGDDRIYGDLITESQQVDTGQGADLIDGTRSDSLVAFGGPGVDTILGSIGNDLVHGGFGADKIIGWIGNDFLDGGPANDNILADAGILDDVELPANPNVPGLQLPFLEGFDAIEISLGQDIVMPNNGNINTTNNTVTSTSAVPNRVNTSNFSRLPGPVNVNLSSTGQQSFMPGRAAEVMRFGATVHNFIGTPFDDRVTVAPAAVARSLDGGQGIDILIVDGLGERVIITPTSVLVGTHPALNITSFEEIRVTNSNGDVRINQGELANVATLRVDGLGNRRLENVSGRLLILNDATSLEINGNQGLDQLTVNFSGGTPIPTGGLTYNGESNVATAGEKLILLGTGAEAVSYVPSATKTIDGLLTISGRVLNFTGLAGVEASGLNLLSIVTPKTNDLLNVAGSAGKNTVSGTSGGIAMVPVTFSGVTTVGINTATNDGAATPNDIVTIQSAGLIAAGLQNFALTTGNGVDELNIQTAQFALPTTGGVFQYDGGTGNDKIRATGNANFTLTNTALSSSVGGSIALVNLSGDQAFLTGGSGVNRFTLTNWAGTASLDGGAGNDEIALTMTGGTVTTVDTLVLVGNVTANVSETSATINGALNLGTTRTFTVGNGTASLDLVVNATLAGAGGITKQGAGTMVLNANSTGNGITTLAAGSLFVNANHATRPVRMTSTGFLGGNGTVGPIGINGQPTLGTISPAGASTGPLTVNGNVVLTPETTFQTHLNGLGVKQFDKLIVNGGVNLGNSTLQAAFGFVSSVGNTFVIIANDNTDVVGGTFNGLAEGAQITLSGRLYRVSYVGGDGNDVTLTHVDTDSAFANRTITSPINENGFATLTGVPVDPDPFDEFILFVNWGDGSPVKRFKFPPGTPRVTLRHRYLDNARNPYKVDLQWLDQHGGGNTDQLQVTVNNLAPRVAIDGQVSGVPGQSRAVHFAAQDPSPVDQQGQFTWRINWGDGAPEQILTDRADLTVEHVYTATGDYTVTATATDKNNGRSSPFSRVIAIREVQLQNGDLAIGGTNGDDKIVIRPGQSAGQVEVWIDDDLKGTFTPSGKIIAFGQNGRDEMSLLSRVIHGREVRLNIPAILDGGAGNDELSADGNLGGAVLLGRGGNDLLTGGIGRDLLIGGIGRDQLHGSGAADILIGGATSHDDFDAALDALMAEWGRDNVNVATRKAHLLGTQSGGLNGDYLLDDASLLDDGEVDSFFGHNDFDWLLTQARDVVRSQ